MRMRIAALVMALLMLLTACTPVQEPLAQATVDVVYIGLCFRQCDDPLTAEYCRLLEESLERQGYYVTRADAKNDQTVQTEQIQKFIERDFDLLLIEPVMLTASDTLMQQLKAAGMPAVFVNREPPEDVLAAWDKACYVGCDADQPGLLQGQLILQTPNKGDVNGDGTVSYAVIGGPADHADTVSRTDSCASALTYSGIETALLATEYGDWTQESGKQLGEKLLADFGRDIEVLFCNNDAMAIGALEALQAAGRTVGTDIYLVGIDADGQALELVKAGAMTGTVSTDDQAQADKVVETVKALLAGQSVEKQYYIDYVKISQENAQ